MTADLFETTDEIERREERLAPGAVVLRRYVVPDETALLAAVGDVIAAAPWATLTNDSGNAGQLSPESGSTAS